MKLYLKSDLNLLNYAFGKSTPENDGITPLAETEQNIDIGYPIVINNQAYALYTIHRNQNYAILEPISNNVFVWGEEPKEHKHETQVTCPYCEYADEASQELDEEDDNRMCPCCGSIFSYQRNIIVTYSSAPVKQAEVLRIK